MPALAPYIPPKDADLYNWSLNFANLLTATPAMFGLLASDATAVNAAQVMYTNAWLLATDPSTRTATTVQEKNTQKVNMLAIIRPYAQQISLNPGVSSSNKTAIGVNPRTSTPIPITTPTTNPIISITAALPLQHIIRYRDSTSSPSVKSKPYGVLQCAIQAMTSATPITDPTLIQQVTVSTKSPFLVTWPSGAAGLRAYYTARWVTRKGLYGPYAPIVNFIVAN